jgi:tetratricopeptide (TPR) repeat protein
MTPEVSGKEIHLDHDHPWPGLISFTEADHSFFFGREREVAELARVIRQESVTVFFGKSGLGKSSILRAGVSPLLRDSEFVPIYVRLNHADEAPPLEDQVEIRLEEILAQEQIEAPKPVRAETLWEYFHKKDCDWWDRNNRLVKPVLIFDQFEELLTVGQASPERAARTASFLTELEDLIENRPPAALLKRFDADRNLARQYELERTDYRVVLTLREDFLPDLEGLRERLRAIMFNRFRLMPLNGEQAMEVILKPGGHLVEEQVALRIIDFVSSSERSRLQNEVTRAQIAQRAIEPALLSVILRELNNRRIQGGQEKITAELVGKAQAAEIFEDFYQRGLAGLADGVREFIEDCLLTSSGARNRIAEEDALTKKDITPAVVATLIDRRIIQREMTGSAKWLELTHDTLADVVRSDRTEHHQRRQVALAAAREAEVRRKLVRTRWMVAGFSVLLLLALYELFDARKQRRELVGRTEAQSQRLTGELRNEVYHPVPGGPERLTGYMDILKEDTRKFDTTNLRATYARALTYAAEISYFHGYIAEGLQYGQTAVDLLDKMKTSGTSDPVVILTQARAHYTVGKGNFEQGLLDKAESSLTKASELADSALKPSSDEMAADKVHIHILSQLGLGDIKLLRGSPGEAKDLFLKVQERLKAEETARKTDLSYYSIQTLARQGRAELDVHESGARFAEAEDKLARAIDPTRNGDSRKLVDLAWRRLSAELMVRHAWIALDYVTYPEKFRLAEAANHEAEVLGKLDGENLDWKVLLARSWRVQGTLEQSGGNSIHTQRYFESVLKLAEEIKQREPAWSFNNYLIATSNYYLVKSRTKAKTAKALEPLEQAREQLELLSKSSPGDADYTIALASALSDIGHRHHWETRYKKAMAHYQEALKLFETLPEPAKNLNRVKALVASLNESMGVTSLGAGRGKEITETLNFYRQAIEIRKAVVKSEPSPDSYYALANTYELVRDAYMDSGSMDEASTNQDLAAKVYDEGLEKFPGNVALLRHRANIFWYMAGQWQKKGNYPVAVKNLRAAAESGKQAFLADPLSNEAFKDLKAISSDAKKFRETIKVAELEEDKRANLVQKLDAILAEINPERLLRPPGARMKDNRVVMVDESTNWALPPFIQGSWRILGAEEQKLEVKYLLDSEVAKQFSEGDIFRIRALALSFYPNTVFFEAEVKVDDGSRGILSYIRYGDSRLQDLSKLTKDQLEKVYDSNVGSDAIRLDGRFLPVHIFNQKHPPILDSASRALDYLRFYWGAVQDEQEGTFRIVDRTEDLHWNANTSDQQREEVQRTILPLLAKETPDGWVAKGTTAFSNGVFYALYRIPPSGIVELTGDSRVSDNLPVVTERFIKGLRVVGESERHQEASRAAKAGKAGKWDEAIKAQKACIELIIKESKNDEEKRRDLPGPYVSLAWYQLHTKDFAGALASSEEGLKLKPRYLPLETNRAHALLFLGKTDEAEKIYRQYMGREIGVESEGQKNDPLNTWEKTILEDFDTLEKDGISHPEFNRIREILKSGPK